MSASKTVLVSGASGLVGKALCECLIARGDSVRQLSRSGGDVQWNIDEARIDESALEGVDAVVHLAGEPIAQRWKAVVKERILNSRVDGTALLAQEIARQEKPPVFISASGSNYYGYDSGGEKDESAASGNGFLAEVCRQWEGATSAAESAGARTVQVRTGMVLSEKGGALVKMLPPFKAGVGGRIGSGQQLMSWISLQDLVAVYLRAIDDNTLSGPINAAAPHVVTNEDFTEALGAILDRPTVLPVPAFAVTLLFGEMGKETVLANVGLVPKRLQEIGFIWQHATVSDALEACLS